MRHLDTPVAVVVAAAATLLATWSHSRSQPALPPPENERFYQNVEWSPDGQSIAFSEFAGGDYSPEKWVVFIASRDGSQWRQLATNATWVTWSPDGKRLAYASRRTGNSEIFVVDVDGHNEIQLTEHPGLDSAPSWSPDGAQIAFSSDREGNVDVFVMKTNGSGVRRLTEGLGNDYNPSWSPDGDQIVFYRSLDDGRDQIWVRDLDGAREWNITDDRANNIFPCFLPSGSIGFASQKPGGSPRVVWVDADGSNRRPIGPYGAFFARWSPDGGTVAFIAGNWPRAAIYVMRFDGVGVQKIVN
jgi:TolB protein